MNVIRAENVAKVVPTSEGELAILAGINLEINAGESVAEARGGARDEGDVAREIGREHIGCRSHRYAGLRSFSSAELRKRIFS